jgi:peptidoglycan hydrolase-like protein with peptidoglycan-binding domain
MNRQRIGAGLVVLLALVAVAAGALGGAFLMPAPLAESEERVSGSRLPVSAEDFTDTRQARVAPEVGVPPELVVTRGGRVTGVDCVPGGTVTSGQVPIVVDGRGVLALATRVPLWRDLSAGTTGDDVRALQEELVRLGEQLTVDGRFGAGTSSAVRDVLDAAGIPTEGTTVSAADFVWLPAGEVTYGTCDLTVGQQATAGAPFATTVPTVASARLMEPPDDLVPGARVVALGEFVAALDENGTATDPAFLGAVERSPQFQSWLQAPEVAPLEVSVELRLADPLPVVRVPPAALGTVNGDRACVSTNAGDLPVRIVGSQLGQAYVTTEAGPLTEVLVPAPGEHVTCG